MAKYKEKAPSRWGWKQILCAVLAVAAVVGCVGGVAAFAGNKTKTVSSLAFKVGALDEAGEYVENDQAIYTKEAFECIGLRVEPEFDAKLTYDVYYYNEDGNVIYTKLGQTGVYDEDFPLAYKARVVVYPEIPDDVDDDDFKITWYNVSEYANALKITVDRKQDYLYEDCVNLYDPDDVVEKKSFANPDEAVKPSEFDSDVLYDRQYGIVTGKISLIGYKKVDVFVKPNNYDGSIDYETAIAFFFAKEDGTIASTNGSCYFSKQYVKAYAKEWIKISLDIPEDIGVDHMMLYVGTEKADVQIYGLE